MDAAREIAARVRAARAYADLDQQRVADQLQISVATLRRIERGERVATRGELRELAELTEVPDTFFSEGWARLPSTEQIEQREVAALEARLAEEARRYKAVMADLSQRLEALEENRSRDNFRSVAAVEREAQMAAEAASRAAEELDRRRTQKPKAS